MPKAYGGVPSSLKLPAGYGPAPVTGITRNFRIGDHPTGTWIQRTARRFKPIRITLFESRICN